MRYFIEEFLGGVLRIIARTLGIAWGQDHPDAVSALGLIMIGLLIFAGVAWFIGKATEYPNADDEDGLILFRGGVYAVFFGGLALVFFAAVAWAWRFLFGR